MANLAGLVTCALVVLVTLNVIPGPDIPVLWQLFVAVSLVAINVLVWKKHTIKPLSLREAGRYALTGSIVLAVITGIDIVLGFFIGGQTLSDAFFRSGVGGVIDIFLIAGALFIGIPSLVKGLCLHYAQPRT